LTDHSGPTDEELLKALEKVGSDLVFREKTRRIMRRIFVLTLFSIAVSVISVAALVKIRQVQIEGCNRDNALRQAYVDQWRPIVADSPIPTKPPDDAPQEAKDAYERSIRSREAFIKSLDTAWGPRSC